LQGFDATKVPAALAARISVTALATVPPELLNQALVGIQTRLAELAAAPPQPTALNAQTSPLDVEDDDDEYEPDFYAAEDTEQILNKLDNAPAEEVLPAQQPDTLNALATLGTFKLPPPPLLDPDLATRVSQVAVSRVFTPLATLEDSSLRKHKAGINRLAASSFDRDSWLTVVIRIATRGTAGLEDSASTIKPEDSSALDRRSPTSLSNSIRELLYQYVLEDFRRRIDVAVAWLCEEWYADQLAKRHLAEDSRSLHYERWAVRLLDGFLPYLTPQDKVLTRFLAEIPELSADLLGKVKGLCRDPTTVQLALTSLLYLVMMRPPARKIALDTVADIWVECKSLIVK
jgi:symplekin